MELTAGKCLPALLLALLAASSACAQVGDEIPHSSYYAAVQAVYSGDYRSAARALSQETKRGIHTTQTRWIDSICYYAMLGEVLYQEGQNAEALAQFDEACRLLLSYPNWMLQVRFQSQPRPDPNRARRAPPWGRSQRNFVIGQFPTSEGVLVGDLDAQKTLQSGGVYRSPMLMRVNVIEVIRMSALAIRRRNEILGPLAVHDPVNKQLAAALAAGNLSPANHWSSAWIDLLRGLAQEGAGRLDEANTLLGRSLVIEGQYDHPLTGMALLEQAHIASLKGDTRRAAQLYLEAGYSAYYFDDWDVLTEAAMGGWLNHVTTGATTVYSPLDPISNWAQTNHLLHISVKTRLAEAESLFWLGNVNAGAGMLDDAARRIGEMRTGLPGIHLLYLQAVLQILQGRIDAGGDSLSRALVAQAGASLRNFQILRTNSMYDSRTASPRIALDMYSALLADPAPADWIRNPLDAMAVVETGHEAAFDRWFSAALERKDAPLALEISERVKRRRYLAAQPLGGRLIALRTILETPDAELSNDAVLQRQQILATYPEYRTLIDAGRKTLNQLVASPILGSTAAETKPLHGLYEQWDHNASQRQAILVQLAVRRLASSLEFPPQRKVTDLQKSLGEGETMVVFHCVGDSLFGVLVTRSSINMWQPPDLRRMRNGLGNFLRAIGNYGANRDLSMAELTSNNWHAAAKEAYAGIFKDSHFDVAHTTSLIIVPDNLLWYLPFEALIPSGVKGDKTLADIFPIRYGPTASLAMSLPRPLRRPQHTGILSGDLKFAGDPPERDKVLQEMVSAVAGPVVLPEPMPEQARLVAPVLDGLVALDDVQADSIADAAHLFPRARNSAKEKASGWVALPVGGPERIAIGGFKTEAQQGLKTPRRESSRASSLRKASAIPGDEIFQSICNLMANGARMVLLSRWRTGGRTNFDLIREFAKESENGPGAEAWQRACLLARENPIDPTHEPRLKKSDDMGDPPKADHPFFWAGYILVDNGPRPEKTAAGAPPKADLQPGTSLPAPAKPGKPAAPPAEKPGAMLVPPAGGDAKGAERPLADGVAPPKADAAKGDHPPERKAN